jgi:hypothetical protein
LNEEVESRIHLFLSQFADLFNENKADISNRAPDQPEDRIVVCVAHFAGLLRMPGGLPGASRTC